MKRWEVEDLLNEHTKMFTDVLRQKDERFWDLVNLLRANGTLPPVETIIFASTAEPSVCGCPVAWTGDERFGGHGRVVYHDKEKCPLYREYLDNGLPTVGVPTGAQHGSA